MTERDALMRKIQEFAFAAYEWNLYLDTHPNDASAIEQFKKMSEACKHFTKEYEKKYGPITAEGVEDDECWSWVDEPWPWQN